MIARSVLWFVLGIPTFDSFRLHMLNTSFNPFFMSLKPTIYHLGILCTEHLVNVKKQKAFL